MANKTYVMTPAEIQILEAGKDDPNVITDYFMKRPGQEHGWCFDHNFTEEGKWQLEMCMASQTFIVVIGGVGTGKTVGVGLSAVAHAILTPSFKFLNIARESWQSMLMYSAVVEHAQGTLLEKLIVASPKRPYPMIVIEYIVNGVTVRSTLEFMSIGEKEDATNIFSWRGDWINIDEAGRLDDLADVVANLSTRGTGVTPDGRTYLGRMSLISNAWENPDLWTLFDMAEADPEDALAINVETKDNQNVTEKQVKQILKLNKITISGDIDRYLTGKRPEGRGSYFGKSAVALCTSKILTDGFREARKNDPERNDYELLPHLGMFYYKRAPQKGRVYFLVGDPGIGSAPSRNAPVCMVFDVTDMPTGAATLTAMWWGDGGNSITPWTDLMVEWIQLYHPLFAGCDSTGPQKNTAELISLNYIYGKGYSVSELTPMDFSGSKRYTYLMALRLTLEAGMIMWPHACSGIGAQLRNYDPIVDRSPNSKLAQDLVATLAMASFAIRAHYGLFAEEGGNDASEQGTQIGGVGRRSREENNWSHRAQRSPAGREILSPGSEERPVR